MVQLSMYSIMFMIFKIWGGALIIVRGIFNVMLKTQINSTIINLLTLILTF